MYETIIMITCGILLLQIIGSNPMFAGNPQLQQQVMQQLPTMLQQVISVIIG